MGMGERMELALRFVDFFFTDEVIIEGLDV